MQWRGWFKVCLFCAFLFNKKKIVRGDCLQRQNVQLIVFHWLNTTGISTSLGNTRMRIIACSCLGQRQLRSHLLCSASDRQLLFSIVIIPFKNSKNSKSWEIGHTCPSPASTEPLLGRRCASKIVALCSSSLARCTFLRVSSVSAESDIYLQFSLCVVQFGHLSAFNCSKTVRFFLTHKHTLNKKEQGRTKDNLGAALLRLSFKFRCWTE